MSKDKAKALAALSEVDYAVYRAKRNQTPNWRNLDHDGWVEFCRKMADWFKNGAADEWDKHVVANKARKAKSDEEALMRKIKAKMAK